MMSSPAIFLLQIINSSAWPYRGVMGLSYDDVRNLPLPDLSLQLLRSLGNQPNFNNLVQGFKQRGGYGEPHPRTSK